MALPGNIIALAADNLIDDVVAGLLENWGEGCHTTRTEVELHRPTLAGVQLHIVDLVLDNEVTVECGLEALRHLRGAVRGATVGAVLATARYPRMVD